jgi:hypothetical protein
MGSTILQGSASVDPSVASNVALHLWCTAPSAVARPGAVTLCVLDLDSLVRPGLPLSAALVLAQGLTPAPFTTRTSTLTAPRCYSGYINTGGADVAFQFGSGLPLVPRVQYMLTSSAEQYEEAMVRIASGAAATDTAPPPTLQSDQVYLNGGLLAVNSEGMLPQYPLPGLLVTNASQPLILPAYTFGFFVITGVAPVPACVVV